LIARAATLATVPKPLDVYSPKLFQKLREAFPDTTEFAKAFLVISELPPLKQQELTQNLSGAPSVLRLWVLSNTRLGTLRSIVRAYKLQFLPAVGASSQTTVCTGELPDIRRWDIQQQVQVFADNLDNSKAVLAPPPGNQLEITCEDDLSLNLQATAMVFIQQHAHVGILPMSKTRLMKAGKRHINIKSWFTQPTNQREREPERAGRNLD
jgi:hypothetical protein